MIETRVEEKDATYYDRLYQSGYVTDRYQPIYDAILDFLARMPAPRVLEVACGTGDLARPIIARGISYRGFDLSPVAIQKCRESAPAGDFQVGNAYEPESYTPTDYNTILAIEVLEHLDDLRAIRNFPEGVHVLLSVPDFLDPAHLRAYLDPEQDLVQRFAGHLTVGQVLPFRFKSAEGQTLTLYLAHGTAGAGPCVNPLKG